MKAIAAFANALLLSGLVAASIQAQTAREIVLSGNRIVDATVNGKTVRFQVNPDQGETPMVNPDLVNRLSLKPSMIGGATYVGPKRIRGGTDLAKMAWSGEATDRRIFWFDIPVVSGADGSIGSNGLDATVIRYSLRQAVAGEIIIKLPIEDRGRSGLVARLKVGDDNVPVFFSLDRAETLVTAATGAALASHYDGSMTEPAREVRVEMGITRPARAMQFGKAIMLDRLPLSNVFVRTADWGNAAAIPEGGKSEDPSEIIVTGKGKKKARQFHRIYVGTDALATCSSLTFDRALLEIRLSCRI